MKGNFDPEKAIGEEVLCLEKATDKEYGTGIARYPDMVGYPADVTVFCRIDR